jgi:hypothetical protein
MGVPEAGAFLKACLENTRPYRDRWQRKVDRGRPDTGVNESAVCRVLAEHLWETGEASEEVQDLARRLKDRVRRALRGEVLTSTTLNQLTSAFGFTADDIDRASELLFGPGPRAVRGTDVLPTMPVVQSLHLTRSLHEHHYVGVDRYPRRHRTVHVIESTTDALTTYPYMFDDPSVTVQIVHGGQISHRLSGLPKGIYGVAIELNEPLGKGETTTLEYVSSFHYTTLPEPEVRRASRRRAENIDIRVEFDPRRLPQEISWCTWDSIEGPITEQRRAPLKTDNAVHRWTPFIDNACIGFRWRW